MAYTAVPTVTTGDLWTAANHNTYIRDNFAASAPDLFTAKGDIICASAANTAVVLAGSDNDKMIVYDSAETGGMKVVLAGRMWLIWDEELTTTAATVEMLTLPQTFKAFKIFCSVRTDNAATYDFIRMRINNDSTADKHVAQRLSVTNTTVTGTEYVTNETSAKVALGAGANATAGYFSGFEITLFDTADTNKKIHWTSIGMWGVGAATGNIQIENYAGLFTDTEVLDRITFLPDAGSNFVANSIFRMYGLR